MPRSPQGHERDAQRDVTSLEALLAFSLTGVGIVLQRSSATAAYWVAVKAVGIVVSVALLLIGVWLSIRLPAARTTHLAFTLIGLLGIVLFVSK